MSSKKSVKYRASVIVHKLLHGCSKDEAVKVIEDALKQQRELDINEFLELMSIAIDEWNEPHRHSAFQIDRSGALIRFTNRLENNGKKKKMD